MFYENTRIPLQALIRSSLNPYYIGRYSMSAYEDMTKEELIEVLILIIILEDTL